MKVKTSVTLDEDLLRALDRVARNGRSRSQIIEDATRWYLSGRARAARESRDLAILNAVGAELNREMEDVLAYQGEV
jgi:metal-responsive CopG/Arc/MetJ family transcriptional regulator